MNKIQPVNANVLIRLDDEKKEQKTSGGLIVPDIAGEKKNEGKIEAIASDAPKTISVGDRVIYKEMSGTEIKYDDIKYLLIQAEDILAKFVEVDEI